ncbi:MAG: replication-relaxation family protein [Armatimonadetes bacterium]|nr:replication-relaxation family protein [Armatimonadota bacterium]
MSLTRDIALSFVLSRGQIVSLGYFSSVSRANTRLKSLVDAGILARLATPYFGQGLYTAGSKAAEIVGERIAPLVLARRSSPRFVVHALTVTNIRLALLARSPGVWRFEQQVSHSFDYDRRYEVRPDGAFLTETLPVFVEADLGHVAPSKFAEKLRSYDAFNRSGEILRLFGSPSFRLLTITTGSRRSRHLRSLLPPSASFEYLCLTHEELGIPHVGAWS